MRKILLLALILISVSQVGYAQRKIDSFIIGGLVINPTSQRNIVDPYINPTWLSMYTDTAASLGLNYGEFAIMENGQYIPNVLPLGFSRAQIQQIIQAYSDRGIKLKLNTYSIFDNWTERMPYARRWVFQAEGDSGFATRNINTGDDVLLGEGYKADVHYTDATVNALKLDSSEHSPGIAGKDIVITNINNYGMPDDVNYFMKIRAKLSYTPEITDTTPVLVITVYAINSALSFSDTLRANQFSDSLKEIRSLAFRKGSIPKRIPENSNESIDSLYSYIDNYRYSGHPDYLLLNTNYSDYDFEIYWLGTRTCWIDYLALDDRYSDSLHQNVYDTKVIASTVNGYKAESGVADFCVWDEPFPPNFYPVRYVNRYIRNLLKNSPYDKKYGLSFNATTAFSHDQFLHETDQGLHLSDIYQIHGWVTKPDTTGNNGYLHYHNGPFGTHTADGIQVVYDKIYDIVRAQAIASRDFNLDYVVALQGHSWKIGNNIWYNQYLREPSLYEMIAEGNMAIGLGVQGIMWNKYSPNEREEEEWQQLYAKCLLESQSDTGIVHVLPRYTDYYGLPKWEGLKAYHKYLKKVGPALLKLTPSLTRLLHKETLPTDSVLSQVQSGWIHQGEFVSTDTNENYVQLSYFFENIDSAKGSKYIHIVNRRTHNRDTNIVICLRFNQIGNYRNWRVEEIGSDRVYHAVANDTILIPFGPGEGKLLRAIPVTKIGYGTYKTSETINEVVTVPSGKTLNIEKGVTLNFGNSGRFISNGTLNINGAVNDSVSLVFDSTAFTSYNTGVRINGGAATIKYAKIKNAYYGVRVLNNAHVTMYGSRLYNNYAGVLLEDNLYSETEYPSTIDSCLIHSNTEGIYFHNGIAYLMKNQIANNGNGILLTTGAYGYTVGVDGGGKNKILNNVNGIHTEDYSIVMVGHDSYQENYNTIDSNNVDLLAQGYSTIEAAYVWWGDDRPTIEMELEPGAYINTEKHLSSAPPDARSIDPIGHDHGYASEGTVSQMRDQQATDDINTKMGFDPAVTSTPVEGSNLNKLLNEARKYFRSGNYYAGAKICKAVIDSNKNDKVSVRALNLLSAESQIHHRAEFRAYIEQLNRVPGMTKIDSYVGLIDAKLDPKKYESKIDALIANYNKKDELLMYLYDKFVHCLLNKEKPDQAIAVYGEMVQRFPESKLTQIAYRMLNPVQFSVSQNLMSTENAQVPKEYGISNNYPNPFNPETSIDYAIPYPSNVVIELYGVTGEKVRTLVQNDHTPGYYTYRLTNTSGMASGIYFYRIAATNLQTGKVYTTVRKMTLMK